MFVLRTLADAAHEPLRSLCTIKRSNPWREFADIAIGRDVTRYRHRLASISRSDYVNAYLLDNT
jgi:hypothetical protein